MKRTQAQNDALHLWFRQVAEQLQEIEYDLRDIPVEIKPTEYMVKECIWKPVQRAMFGKQSTKELEKMEVSDIYEHLNRWLAQQDPPIHVPFPSEEEQ